MVESRKAVEGLIFRPLTLRERTLIATVRAKNLSPLPTLKGNRSVQIIGLGDEPVCHRPRVVFHLYARLMEFDG